MARRAASHESSDSLKENNGLPSSKSINGPGKTPSGRTATRGKRAAMRDHVEAADEEEEDAQVDEDAGAEDDKDADGDVDAEGEDEDDDDGEHSPKGRKRARVNTDGDSRPTGSGAKPEKRGQTLPRDVDGYVPTRLSSFSILIVTISKFYPRIYCPDTAQELPYLRLCGVPPWSIPQHDFRP